MSDKQLLFAQISEKIGSVKNSKNLAIEIFKKRKEIKAILEEHQEIKQEYQSGNHTNWYLFVADFREYLGFPRFMDLATFNALTEVIMTSGESLDYDEFLKTFRRSHAKSIIANNKYKKPDVSKKIKNQGERLAQGLVEIIANAVDATVPDKNIGRFGEGFYQALKFLVSSEDLLEVSTKKEGEKGFEISLKNDGGENKIGSVGNKKDYNGTIVTLKRNLSQNMQDTLKDYVKRAFKTNKKVNVFLNGEQVNNLGEYNYYNGEGLEYPTQRVEIEVNENGFRVVDTGVGMSAQELCEKLLYLDASGKKRLNSDSMTDDEIEKFTRNETSFFYKYFGNDEQYVRENKETKRQKTSIRLQVGGVLIEDFYEQTSYDIKEFCIDLPSFTWLPKSRNKIELTKEVVTALKIALEKVSQKIQDPKEKVILLEIIGKIIQHLKSRESSKASTKSKYDISKIAKDEFKKIKQELENNGKTVISSIPGIQEIIPENENIVFIDPTFLNFEVEKIPGIKKLKNVSRQTKPFYSLEFSSNSPYDYLILQDTIIVNARYLKTQDDLDKINAQVNLNTGYEHGEDRVFYGIIRDDEEEVREEKGNNVTLENEDVNLNDDDNYTQEEVDNFIRNLEYIKDNILIRNGDFLYSDLDNFVNKRCSLKRGFFQMIEYSIGELVLFYFALIGERNEFSELFFKTLIDFIKNNSESIVNIYIKFHKKINKIEIKNKEKYLLQIISLLNDEKNAKYIVSFIEDLENISESDLKKLFAHFEGEESDNNQTNGLSQVQYNTLISLKNKYNIEKIEQIKIGPNGEFYGEVEIGGKKMPFLGDKIIYKIGGKDIERVDNIGIGSNGEFYGIIWTGGKKMPFLGDKIIYKIGGKDIERGDNVGIGPNGEFYGEVKIGFKKMPFLGDEIIYKIGGKDIEWCDNVGIGPNGEFYGRVLILGNFYLFIGDKIIYKIGGKDIEGCDVKGISPNGEFYGIVKVGGKWHSFLGDEIIYKIGGKDIEGFSDIGIGPNLKLYGRVVVGGKFYPFLGDEIKYKIGGKNFDGCEVKGIGPNLKLYGKVVVGGKSYPFLGDEIKYKIGGKDFDGCEVKGIGPNGELYGKVFISGEWHEFIGDTILDEDFLKKDNGNHSPKTLAFIEFLCKGGEFLEENENKVEFESKNDLLLTDIIGISKHFSEETESINGGNAIEAMQLLKQKISKKLKNREPFQRQITSTIDGQDRASMIWIREVVQNSRDAILKAKRNGLQRENIDDINIEFYQNNDNWISRISDNIGMSSYEVFKYLLTPGESGKTQEAGSTGMFGQGFYSLAIGAKEIRVKTSTGDGKTTYVQLTPIYNENKDIIDFKINYEVKNEQFTGTIIERVDDSEGVSGNIGALVGLQNMQKYVGNVDDVNIKYNGKETFDKNDVITLQTENVGDLGILSLKQNKDKSERLTKDNLFISEIKDEYLDFLPDFMIEFVRKNGYSLDLPHTIGLTDTRNSITDFEENIEILSPYIFNLITRQIIKDYLAGKVRLPMMPLDYYGLDLYEIKFNKNIVKLAKKVNKGGVLSSDEMEKLKDKNLMIQYLINLQIENAGETISIRELKQRRDDEVAVRRHTNNSYTIYHNAERLNAGMESGNRQRLEVGDNDEKKEFLNRMQQRFAKLTQKLFGCEIEFGFYQRLDKEETRAVDYGFNSKGNIYFNFNTRFWDKYKSDENYEIIEFITHEFTHIVEKIVKSLGVDFEKEIIEGGNNFKEILGDNYFTYIKDTGFGSHQKDLTHEHSFERIQRQILKMMQRESI